MPTTPHPTRAALRASWYAKNLPAWERAARLLAALLMTACAWQVWARLHHGPAAATLAGSALVTALTAVVGFCPMCALAGRRIQRAADAARNA